MNNNEERMLCDVIALDVHDPELELALLEEVSRLAVDIFGAESTIDNNGDDLPLGILRLPHPVRFDIGSYRIIMLGGAHEEA